MSGGPSGKHVTKIIDADQAESPPSFIFRLDGTSLCDRLCLWVI